MNPCLTSDHREGKSAALEVCILAGGTSERMGRDKAGLRLGRWTFLGRARAISKQADLPVRVVRRDRVPRCGPLGGVYTALVTSHAGALLFLSCDMPFVTPDLLRNLVSRFHRRGRACFVVKDGVAGFPFLLRRADLGTVKRLLSRKHFSLQNLTKALGAQAVRVPNSRTWELFNVNTPADLKAARQHWRDRRVRTAPERPRPSLSTGSRSARVLPC